MDFLKHFPMAMSLLNFHQGQENNFLNYYIQIAHYK